MFNILSLIFRYLFILIIYFFIFSIIRLIYLDIRSFSAVKSAHSYLRLIVLREYLPFDIEEVYLLDRSVRIGRNKGNDIVINDPFISSEHLNVIKDGDEFFIDDAGSANGTYVNGKRIEGRTHIKNQDRIRMGQVEFLFVSK
ncbi:FHA domain-containing protein [Peptoclostridium litorale DSM 5388]|uniref:Forkhead-associated (FHA) domain-containing protein n=1 Tax=Peptoclostridium litorale DSM 5388 TaxID=1121324 RepID=A0A069RD56_PEPLI|nr:FHA domain-containing protein [Peptoclostridium litorale]KDR94971.1 forkhead-associated (FHA) domain-containing protein [Peptoclostridium litorale DSM 5388]SIO33641.1 FHA domain-containing protein [Peptoclostridium litorale DSM 5388]